MNHRPRSAAFNANRIEDPPTGIRAIPGDDVDVLGPQAMGAMIPCGSAVGSDLPAAVQTREGLVASDGIGSDLGRLVQAARASQEALSRPIYSFFRQNHATGSGEGEQISSQVHVVVQLSGESLDRPPRRGGVQQFGSAAAHIPAGSHPAGTFSIATESTVSPCSRLRTTSMPRVTSPNLV